MKGTCLSAREDEIGGMYDFFVLGDIIDKSGSSHISKWFGLRWRTSWSLEYQIGGDDQMCRPGVLLADNDCPLPVVLGAEGRWPKAVCYLE